MEAKRRKSLLTGIPSWGLALLTLVLAFPILMIVVQIIAMIFKIPEDIAEWIFYIPYNLIIALGCYYTCRQYPKSILYVPVLCNIVGISSALLKRISGQAHSGYLFAADGYCQYLLR
jgi:hypothetical protein